MKRFEQNPGPAANLRGRARRAPAVSSQASEIRKRKMRRAAVVKRVLHAEWQLRAPAKYHPIQVFIIGKHARNFSVPIQREKRLIAILNELAEVRAERPLGSRQPGKRSFHAGEVLKTIRQRRKLSQMELARKLGTSQSDISKIENNRRPIGKKIAKKLSDILETNYRFFL